MERQRLAGQTALVTGGSSGIGAAIARALGADGARVAVNYSARADAAERVAADIRAAGGEALTLRADVAREDDVDRMFDALLGKWPALDILVNNAGVQRDAAVVEMTLEQWNAVLGVNLTGMFLCARRAARAMVKQGVRPDVSRAAGKIVCVSSVHETIPWAGHANYSASKGGVRMLMQSLAQELAPRRIRVNSIAPGAIRTPINRAAWETDAALATLLKLITYGRIGEPEDIGRVAAWLVSDEADYIQGQTIFVDGGMTLYPEFSHGG